MRPMLKAAMIATASTVSSMRERRRLDNDRSHGTRHLGQEIVLVLASAADERALGEEGSEIAGKGVTVGGGQGGIVAGGRGAEGLDSLGPAHDACAPEKIRDDRRSAHTKQHKIRYIGAEVSKRPMPFGTSNLWQRTLSAGSFHGNGCPLWLAGRGIEASTRSEHTGWMFNSVDLPVRDWFP
jgi:hypothetical protein